MSRRAVLNRRRPAFETRSVSDVGLLLFYGCVVNDKYAVYNVYTYMEKQPQPHLESQSGLPDEFDFHQERFDTMARNHAERGILKRVMDWNAKMSAKDFAHVEALRDDAEFERRKDKEFLSWQANLRVVVDNLLEKRDQSDGAEGKDIRPLLLILGGGMKGPYGAGQALLGLPAVGLGKVFDTVVGVSAGAATAAYFVAGGGQASKGASIFYEECTAGEFINPKRIHQIMNIDVVTDAMSHGEKALDQEAVHKSKTGFYVAVTRKGDWQSELVNAKTAKPGMITAVGASMAVPLLYRKAVKVNGEQYVDGAFDPMPIERIIEQFNPTDILVLPNTPFDRLDAFELTPGQYLFAELAHATGSIGSLGTVEKFLRIKEEIRASLEHIQTQQNVNIGILWPPDSNLSNLTTDPDKVEAAIMESARGVIKEFGAEQPKELGVYHSSKL
jgi:predicted acylesterase/phospholipase RssA